MRAQAHKDRYQSNWIDRDKQRDEGEKKSLDHSRTAQLS
jgi:hypothetical protein